jgi:hypothetical protein
MATSRWGAYSLTGESTGSLDNLDADNIEASDTAIVIASDFAYFYMLNTDGTAENSPDYIDPKNVGSTNKSWKRVTPYIGANFDLVPWWFTGLTGGGSGNMDGVDGDDLSVGNRAITIDTSTYKQYSHIYLTETGSSFTGKFRGNISASAKSGTVTSANDWALDEYIQMGGTDEQVWVFDLTTIPSGATITAATISQRGIFATTNNSVTNIKGIKDFGGAYPPDGTNEGTWTLTTANTDWTITDSIVAGTEYTSPDLSTELQEIYDNTIPAEGVAFYGLSDGTGGQQLFQTYDAVNNFSQSEISANNGWWSMDAVTGSTLEEANNLYDGTLTNIGGSGAPAQDEDTVAEGSYSLVFTRANNHIVTVPYDANFNFDYTDTTLVLTWSAWIKTNDYTADENPIISLGDLNSNNKYTIFLNTDGKLHWFHQYGRSSTRTTAAAITDNNWHHIIWSATMNASDNIENESLYVDGVLTGCSNTTGGAGSEPSGNDFLRFGAGVSNVATIFYNDGNLDDIRFWRDWQPTYTEAQEIYNSNSFAKIAPRLDVTYTFTTQIEDDPVTVIPDTNAGANLWVMNQLISANDLEVYWAKDDYDQGGKISLKSRSGGYNDVTFDVYQGITRLRSSDSAGDFGLHIDNTATSQSAFLQLNEGQKINKISTDGTFAENLDTNLMTEAAIRTYVRAEHDDLVGIDDAATPGFLGAAYNDGVLRTADNAVISYTDGGDFVTLDIAANGINDTHIDWGTGANQVSAVDIPIADSGGIITGTEVETALQENRTAIDLNTTHRSSDGSDHTFIDQDVTTTATPAFTGLALDTNVLVVDGTNDWIGIGRAVGESDTNSQIDILMTATKDILIDGGVMRFEQTPAIENTRCITLNVDANSQANTHGMAINMLATQIAAGERIDAIDIELDTGNSTGGSMHGLEVSRVGTGSITGYGVYINPGVEPLYQESGSYGNIEQAWENDGGWTDRTAAFNSTGTDVQLFANNSAEVYIGDAGTFDKVEIVLATDASGAGIKPTFEFSDGVGGWTAFTPEDDSLGFRQSGILSWVVADLAGWATDTVNGTANKYWIRITRTATSLTTPPTEDRIQIQLTTDYYWNDVGAVYADTFDAATDFTVGGTVIIDDLISFSSAGSMGNPNPGFLDIYVTNTDVARIYNNTDGETIATFTPNGAVTLYYDNSAKVATSTTGLGMQGSSGIDFSDNGKIRMGSAQEAEIYEDGTNLIIDVLNTDPIKIRNRTDNEEMAVFTPNGAVDLYYDGTKVFDTTTTGIKAYNKATGEQFYVSVGAAQTILATGDAGRDILLQVRNGADSAYEDGILIYADGAVELYYDDVRCLSTEANGINVGTLGYGEFRHNGTHMYLDNGLNGSNIYLRTNNGNETGIAIIDDGAVDLYWNNQLSLSAYGTANERGGLEITSGSGTRTTLLWTEETLNRTVLYHNGADGYILLSGLKTGPTYPSLAKFSIGGSVDLYYDGTKQAATTSTGWGPGTHQADDLGSAALEWQDCYLTNSPTVSSDKRMKEQIKNSDLGLDFINELNPVSYKFKDKIVKEQLGMVTDEDGNVLEDERFNDRTITHKRIHYGIIAQEVEEVLDGKDFGGLIYDKEADKYSLRYEEFIAPMIKAIQEQQKMIEELKQEIEELKNGN